jgi:hypothetical protein
MHKIRFWLLVFLGCSNISPNNALAQGISCTDGTDCYCDCVSNSTKAASSACITKWGSNIYDASLLGCEDFEAITLYGAVGTGTLGMTGPGSGATACTPGNQQANCYGNTANALHGPWYDITGDSTPASPNVGFNSYWYRMYGSNSGPQWDTGYPVNPIFGGTCTRSDGQPGECSGMSEYCSHAQGVFNGASRDCWRGNQFAAIDIQRHGEHNDDDDASTYLAPSNARGGIASGVFDGLQSFAQRVRNFGSIRVENAKTGTMGWSNPEREIGITMAFAYSDSVETSGVFLAPWKHNEWEPGDHGAFMFWNVTTTDEAIPFTQTVWIKDASSCSAAIAGATLRKGYFNCDNPDTMRYGAETNTASPRFSYRRSQHWNPLRQWKCVRSHFRNIGDSNFSVRIQLDNIDVVDFEGVDGRIMTANPSSGATQSVDGFTGFNFNAYSNSVQNGNQVRPSFRYQDNVHVRRGAPVSCAQIGFGTAAGTPPNAPSNLRVQ